MISRAVNNLPMFGYTSSRLGPLHWIVRLRWWAVFGQLLTVAIAIFVAGIHLPTIYLIGVIAVLAASTLWLSWQKIEVSVLGWITLLDVFLLTFLLALSGGATNPFSIFYLVHVALSAVLLSAVWTWTIALGSSCAFGALFFYSIPVPELHMHHGHGVSFHLVGMWIAFTLAACLIAYFQTRIVHAVRTRDEKLQRLIGRQERLASVTTLAAGAAHELGTPLGTIALAATEIKRALSLSGKIDREAISEDASLIMSEIARCRLALEQIALGAGETVSETPAKVTLGEVTKTLESLVQTRLGKRFDCSCDSPEAVALIPVRGLTQSILALIKNANEAGSKTPVQLKLSAKDEDFIVTVKDHGHGMDLETVNRLGEPFFSLKGAGQGMGLGVFLVRLFAERLGGQLNYKSIKGEGTEAILSLPRSLVVYGSH